MVSKVTDPQVRIGLDPTQFEKGSERVILSYDQMSLAQKRYVDRQQRQGAMMASALREDQARQAALASAVEAAERKKQAAMSATGRIAMTSGAALLAGLALAGREAVNWQADFAGVRKTVQGTDEQMAALQSQLRGLSLVLPSSHDDIAAVAEAAGQLGVKTESIASFTHVMLDLGNTTTMTADEAATALAQLMNIMQTAPNQVSNLGSTVLALGNAGAATEATIVDMAQRMAGAAKTIGMSTADVLGFAGAVSSVGVDAEAGGSAMSRIMINIAQSVSANGAKLQTWAKVAGMSARDFTAAWKTSPAKALDAVFVGLGRLQKSGQDVFGVLADVDAQNIRTTQTLLSVASAGALVTDQVNLANQAWADNTQLAASAAQRYDTVAAKTQIAKNAIADSAITIGNSMLPVLSRTATDVADLAKWIGGLPPSVLQAATVLGALAGATLLVGGAVITARVKWMQYQQTLREVAAAEREVAAAASAAGASASASGTIASTGGRGSAVIAGAGKVLGAVTAMTMLEQANNAFVKSNDEVAASVQRTTQVLLDAKSATDLDQLFLIDGKKDAARGGIDQINGLDDAIRRLVHPNVLDGLTEFQSRVGNFLGGKDRSPKNYAADQFKTIGQSLASLVNDGRADEAGRQFGMLADRWTAAGGKLEDLRNLMPEYADALAAADTKQKQAASSAENLVSHYNAALNVTQQLTDAQQQYLDSVAQSDAAMVSLSDAYSGAVDDAQAAAQATADAYNKEAQAREDASKKRGISLTVERKQWQDFYDGKTVTIAAYLGKLAQQADQQNQWESDLLTLAGRGVNQETIDMLRSQGKDLAPVVHQFAATGTAAQLAQLQTLAAQGGASATQQFADQLVSGTPVLAAAGAQLGDATVSAMVDKLVRGKATLQQLVYDYGLIVAGMPTMSDFKAGLQQTWKPGTAAAAPSVDLTTPANAALTRQRAALPAPGLPWNNRFTPGPRTPTWAGAIQVVPVPVPVQTKVDQSTNFNGPTTFSDPTAAKSTADTARANTAGRRAGGPVKVS